MGASQPPWMSWARRAFQAARRGLAWLGLLCSLAWLLVYFRPDFADLPSDSPAQGLNVADRPAHAGAMMMPVDLSQLPPAEVPVAQWLGTKYRVAPEAVAALLREALTLSKTAS